MIREMIAILDFGSQYIQLIARRVREHNVYSRIFPARTPVEELSKLPLRGIILSGGPASVSESHPHDIQITKEAPNYSASLPFED